jgi:hypothetical protein
MESTGEFPGPQLFAGVVFCFQTQIRTGVGDGWMSFQLVETRWRTCSCTVSFEQVWHARVKTGSTWNTLAMFGSEESVVEDRYQVLNWLENMSFLAGSGTERLEPVETGWNWLNIVGLVETHWQWLAVRSLRWRTATTSSTGWMICQFYLGLAGNCWNWLKLVEYSWIGWNALAMIDSEDLW